MSADYLKENTTEEPVKKSFLLRFILIFLAVLLPLPLLLGTVYIMPSMYEDTFLGELSPKVDLLKNTDKPKIVVVGGSSVAFGLDSELLAEHTGYEVVNFGLYATLGTRVMLDLSKDHINEGDIVVVAPELDKQTLSLYFNGEAFWQAAESDLSLLSGVHFDNYLDLAANLIGHLSDVFPRIFSGEGKISPNGIYRKDSFNKYGDIVYPRDYNVMTAGYDMNQIITLSKDLYDGEFVDYLNDYINALERRGARVYYSFCPVNKSALSEGTDEKQIETFYFDVCKMIDCPVISNPNDFLLDEGYFYDTNFHLNDAGVVVRTARLIDDINRAEGNTENILINIPEVPEKPLVEDSVDWEENEWSKLFLYEPFGEGLRIVGVTDEAKSKERLEIPYKAEGRTVLVLSAGAFSECKKLKEITVYENITLMENGLFKGADNLTTVHMKRENAEELEAGADLFVGASKDITLYFYTETSFQNFVSGYWWSIHAEHMKKVSG